MDNKDAFDRAEVAKRLVAKGAEIIAALRVYINEHFADQLTVLDTSTEHRVYVTFYGLPLLFRIEICWGGEAIRGFLSAFALVDADMNGLSLGVSRNFDLPFNTPESMPLDIFFEFFLVGVFGSLHEKDVILRP